MKLFQVADEYCKTSDWKVLALLKFCLFSIGLMVGALLPARYRRPAIAGACAVFLATYLPLMAKFFRLWRQKD